MREEKYDKRKALCEKLEHFLHKNPDRKDDVTRLLQFVRHTPACFERSNSAGHITGSAWLLNPVGDKALMTQHRKLKRWLQLGGHADGQGDTLAVALREAEEESGIGGIGVVSDEIFDIDIHLIPKRPGEAAHYHYDIRYLLRAPHENFRVSAESDALAWWSAEDFIRRAHETDAAVLRMAAITPGIPPRDMTKQQRLFCLSKHRLRA